jgi:phosphoglycolate phosphatase-like HAD superfamily hydrolase
MDLSDIAAVLFDMDGTLVNSDAAVERAWTSWAAEHGVDGREAIALAHGSPSEPRPADPEPHRAGGGVPGALGRSSRKSALGA